MIADLNKIDDLSVGAQIKLLELENAVKDSSSKSGVNSPETVSAKQAYADAYESFIESVNPDLLAQSNSKEGRIKKTRLSAVGANIGDRIQENTTPEIMARVQKDAFDTYQVLSKLSVDQRVEIMNEFKAAVMPSLKGALSTMITVAVGKSTASATGELEKALQWFSFLADPEQKNVIKNVSENGIKHEGFHVRDHAGQPITRREQLHGKLNVTFYNASTIDSASLPENGQEAKGNGITFSQPPKNYPFALGIGDPLLAMFAGNATVMKVPADMQDIMDTFARYWNSHIAQYAASKKDELGLEDSDLEVLEKEKVMQVVTGYGYEAIANNVRVVSSLDVGRQVYENYIAAKSKLQGDAQKEDESLSYADDAKRFSAELAGANVMYIADNLSDDELKLAAKQWLARVIDNNGMICTKIEDGMVHQAVAKKFAEFVENEWLAFDKNTLGKPHLDGKYHGVHTDPGALQKARDYLSDAEKIGAKVVGGEIAEDGLSMTPAMVFWPDTVLPIHLEQRAKNIENFAPISNFIAVRNVEQAIEITNISQCSLTSSIWSKDPEDISKFVSGTTLGSYNIFNPKHGSDNAPFGEHIGVYHHVKYHMDESSSETRELHIEDNGVTGGHSQILNQLKLSGVQNARFAVHFDGTQLASMNGNNKDLALFFNVRSMTKIGVDLARDTGLPEEEIRVLAQDLACDLSSIAPSIN